MPMRMRDEQKDKALHVSCEGWTGVAFGVALFADVCTDVAAMASVDSAERRVIEYNHDGSGSTAPDIAYIQHENRVLGDHPTSTGNLLKPVKQRLNALRE